MSGIIYGIENIVFRDQLEQSSYIVYISLCFCGWVDLFGTEISENLTQIFVLSVSSEISGKVFFMLAWSEALRGDLGDRRGVKVW